MHLHLLHPLFVVLLMLVAIQPVTGTFNLGSRVIVGVVDCSAGFGCSNQTVTVAKGETVLCTGVYSCIKTTFICDNCKVICNSTGFVTCVNVRAKSNFLILDHIAMYHIKLFTMVF